MAESLSEALADYIGRTAKAGWQWGVIDCTTWAADWIVLRTGIDPMAHWRGQYASEAEAEAILAETGLIERWDAESGLPRQDEPMVGDAGVIDMRGQDTMALCLGGGRWAFRHPEGVGVVRVEPKAVWAV